MSCPCEKLAGKNVTLSPVCIGHLWMFKDLDPGELGILAESAIRCQWMKGDYVFRQDDDTMEMFLLKSGRVKLTKILENGNEITLDIRKAGDFIGENLLSENLRYPVNAVCMETTLTCGFSQKLFESIILRYPNIGLQVIRNMSERITLLTDRVESMAVSNIEERLYSALKQMAAQHGITADSGVMIQFSLTHEELGFLIGAHRVSVTRAMKFLKQTGRILEEGKHIVISEM